MTHRPVSPAYMNFLLYGPMAPFTSMSLTSVTVSCMTCGPVLPAVYTNFLLHGPVLLSHLVYNLWACGTLYVEPHIHPTYNSQACIALIHIFIYLFCGLMLPSVVLCTTYGPALPLYMFLFIYSVGLHCPQLSWIQLTGLHCPCTMNTSDMLMMPL